mmetsp:Transcript_22878/g.44627  ORF Transcript_22878/g.44627 Transcript_22878/m.44627 type:complete len:299 (-) Transcript_22878:75-971(-)
MEFKDVPVHFLCPISQDMMENPTINEAGQTYEYESIVDWYAMGKRTDPLTRKAIQSVQVLIPNHALKSQIQEWKQNYPQMQRKKMEQAELKLAHEISARDNQDTSQQTTPKHPKNKKAKEEEEKGKPEDWTEEQVASFVRELGNGIAWQRCAELCVREGIDGSTLVDATLEDLVECGIKKIHAGKILQKFKQAAGIRDGPAIASVKLKKRDAPDGKGEGGHTHNDNTPKSNGESKAKATEPNRDRNRNACNRQNSFLSEVAGLYAMKEALGRTRGGGSDIETMFILSSMMNGCSRPFF